uniref:EGF-like domain-containing protein n=1 Tax=Biomphalaria glabrata TaxID=6526 RepID=A0A2C9L293_BIOGL
IALQGHLERNVQENVMNTVAKMAAVKESMEPVCTIVKLLVHLVGMVSSANTLVALIVKPLTNVILSVGHVLEDAFMDTRDIIVVRSVHLVSMVRNANTGVAVHVEEVKTVITSMELVLKDVRMGMRDITVLKIFDYIYSSSECPSGQYGHLCLNICSPNCGGNEKCDHVTGSCLEGCKDGFTGHHCNEECPSGQYGQMCLHICSPNCGGNEKCDHVNGSCLEGCRDGFTGHDCNEGIDLDGFVSTLTGERASHWQLWAGRDSSVLAGYPPRGKAQTKPLLPCICAQRKKASGANLQ